MTVTALGTHPRIVERIKQRLNAKSITSLKNGGFNHYRVAQAVLPILTSEALQPDDFARFKRLFDRVTNAL